MKYKAIFFDLDGTLTILKSNTVPKSAKKALQMAKENGVKLFLATGRHPLFLRDSGVVGELTFDGYLTTNGQYCFNDEGIIFKKVICQEDKEALVKQLKEDPYPLLFLAENKMYINMYDGAVEEGNRVLNAKTAPIEDPKICLDQDIFALMTYGSKEVDEKLLSVMKHCKAPRWHPSFSDVIPADGGKDKGIDAILAYYNIDPSETMAIGDAENDICMLRHVGLGIAMGNAADEVKASAKDVTATAGEDGIYLALKKWNVI